MPQVNSTMSGVPNVPIKNLHGVEKETKEIKKPEDTKNIKDTKDSNAALVEALKENNQTTKKIATASVIMSCATLLPLSVLAVKAHGMNNTIKDLKDRANPAIDNVTKILENFMKSSDDLVVCANFIKDTFPTSVQDIFTQVKTKIDALNTAGLSEKAIEFVNFLKEKISSLEAEKGNIAEGLVELIETAQSKIWEVNKDDLVKVMSDVFNNSGIKDCLNPILEKLSKKLETVDLSTLSTDARSVIKELKDKINGIDMNTVNQNIESILQGITAIISKINDTNVKQEIIKMLSV